MLTKDRINKFYEDLEKLGLKYPVAEIAQKTGYSKGNVSVYVKRVKEPSENFLKRFYSEFYNSSNLVKENVAEPRATYQNGGPNNNSEDFKDKYILLLEKINDTLINEFRASEALKNKIENKLQTLEANLKTNQEYLKVVMAQIKAASLMAVQRHAGQDKKKFVEERRALDKLVGEFLTEA